MPHPPQIPLTPQTDDRNFPRWQGEDAPHGQSGARYPKMLTRKATVDDYHIHVKKNKRMDASNRDGYYEIAPPIGEIPLVATPELVIKGFAKVPGEPLIADTADKEREILEYLGLLEPIAPVPSVSLAQVTQQLDKTLGEEWVAEAPKKKRGRPPKVKAAE